VENDLEMMDSACYYNHRFIILKAAAFFYGPQQLLYRGQ